MKITKTFFPLSKSDGVVGVTHEANFFLNPDFEGVSEVVEVVQDFQVFEQEGDAGAIEVEPEVVFFNDNENSAAEEEVQARVEAAELPESYDSAIGFLRLNLDPENSPSQIGDNPILFFSQVNSLFRVRDSVMRDVASLGGGSPEYFPLEGPNLTHVREDIMEKLHSENYPTDESEPILLNLRLANFWEHSSCAILCDNRPFLSELEDPPDPQSPSVDRLKEFLFSGELSKLIRKLPDRFLVDSVSFNNDELSFFCTREALSRFRENSNQRSYLVDVIVNERFVNEGHHKNLVRFLGEWKREPS